jgi:hypothetical protein
MAYKVVLPQQPCSVSQWSLQPLAIAADAVHPPAAGYVCGAGTGRGCQISAVKRQIMARMTQGRGGRMPQALASSSPLESERGSYY